MANSTDFPLSPWVWPAGAILRAFLFRPGRVEKEFHGRRFDLPLQRTAREQFFVIADAVASIGLGVIQRLIGMAEDDDRRFGRIDAHETNRNGDLPHLREHVLFDVDPPKIIPAVEAGMIRVRGITVPLRARPKRPGRLTRNQAVSSHVTRRSASKIH